MTLVSIPGAPIPIGPGFSTSQASPTSNNVVVDAAKEACVFIGHILTSDGASHTIDTSGSSSLGWRTGATTFSNGSTTVSVGLAAVLTTAGPVGRAVNVSDVITLDVSKSMTGGGGGVTANAWQTHVPDAGTKTIANGDLVAFCVQMTARAGADSVEVVFFNNNIGHRPYVSAFIGGSYSLQSGNPNAIITFSDGALGFFHASEVFSTFSSLTWNSGSATKEYGQLYNLPFPIKIAGIYGWVSPDNDFDVVLYSDPLGTPVAEKTISIDANTVAGVSVRKFSVIFAAPYTTTASQNIATVFKPGASNISTTYRTLASAGHRLVEPYGTSGYGISRAAGAFANANSSLDNYYIGLLVSAFDAGGPAGRTMLVNNGSVVG